MSLKILLTGPECTGKSTLSKQLQNALGGFYVEEFAREFLKNLGRPYQREDLNAILDGQLNLEEQALAQNPSFLFCDTGPEVIWVWSKAKYGVVDPEIEQQLVNRHYDLYLLCFPDLNWVADPLRETPDLKERLAIFEAYEQLFQLTGTSYQVVRGHGDERLAGALDWCKGLEGID